MAVEVTVREKPREFDVSLGTRCIGRLRVYAWPENRFSRSKPVRAEFFCPASKEYTPLDWHRNIRMATKAILVRAVGEGTVDEIHRRPAP